MFCTKSIAKLLLFCIFTQNYLKTPVKGFKFNRVAGLQFITLLKNELFHEHFLRILNTSAKHLLVTKCFSEDIFKVERTIDFPFDPSL